MSDLKEMSDEEKEGVKAMQYLLSLTNNKEPEWVSLKNWRAFNNEEKSMTLDVYRTMKSRERERT